MPFSEWFSDTVKERATTLILAGLIGVGAGGGAGWGATQLQAQQATTSQAVTDLSRRVTEIEGTQDTAVAERSEIRERLVRLETKIDLLLRNENIHIRNE